MSNWWIVGFGLYVYQLPWVLYTVWVTLAIWDVARREEWTDGKKIGWMAGILIVPVLGPLAYYIFGRSPMSPVLRFGLVGGSAVIYATLALLMVWVAPS